LGDASLTEGEVSEALQFAVLKELPIIYLVQDNSWGISVTAREARKMDAVEYAAGYPGLTARRIDGSNFTECYHTLKQVTDEVRTNRKPQLLQASVPLLGHHTSGVRREFYRAHTDLAELSQKDPGLLLRNDLRQSGIAESEIESIEDEALVFIQESFAKAVSAPEPDPSTIMDFVFAETPVIEEKGERSPAGNEKILMVDAALFSIREIMNKHPEALLYGQDVGKRLGGVFRETATLAEKFGESRVFNTAIQEAYIIGSTVGMSATGAKPIVEVQFADYLFPGFNQLVTEVAKSCYLSCGKFPVQALIRVPIGAYGGGGPYHSASIESTLLTVKGIKIVYPSNSADMKGLMKAAFYDPNPVIMLEHKGLYWGKVPGTENAKTIEPSEDYIIPLGKGNIVLRASEEAIENGRAICVVTYGMGVHWIMQCQRDFEGLITLIDLRCLFPLDEDLVYAQVMKHGKCLVLTEEQQNNSFAEAFAARISKKCFQWLDAPVEVIGAADVPAVPMNIALEKAVLPSLERIKSTIEAMVKF
jgi:2-oxoisovalerate dehydrogenase E1 component